MDIEKRLDRVFGVIVKTEDWTSYVEDHALGREAAAEIRRLQTKTKFPNSDSIEGDQLLKDSIKDGERLRAALAMIKYAIGDADLLRKIASEALGGE